MKGENLPLLSATNIPQFQYFGMIVKSENVALRQLTVECNPLNTKRRLLYLKTQFVPRSKFVGASQNP